MYAETLRQPDRVSERSALVSHLLSHLARSARAMRVATQLSRALGTTTMSLTMSGALPVLRDEQQMLRALLLTLADPSDIPWPMRESRRERILVDTPVASLDAPDAPDAHEAPDAPERRDASGAPDAHPAGNPIGGHESVCRGRTIDALLDAMVEGCWGRLALWRALAERSRRSSPHDAVDFASLARRTEAMIGELESLQDGGVPIGN